MGSVDSILLILAFYVTSLTGLCPPKQPTPPSVVVDLGYTRYAGTQLSSGLNEFLGMRYAAAPTGDLRWRAPVEPLQTNATEQATTVSMTARQWSAGIDTKKRFLPIQFQPLCLGINAGYPAAGQSEDCLFVNVWAPSNATAASKLPVWVFIPGGGMSSPWPV